MSTLVRRPRPSLGWDVNKEGNWLHDGRSVLRPGICPHSHSGSPRRLLTRPSNITHSSHILIASYCLLLLYLLLTLLRPVRLRFTLLSDKRSRLIAPLLAFAYRTHARFIALCKPLQKCNSPHPHDFLIKHNCPAN